VAQVNFDKETQEFLERLDEQISDPKEAGFTKSKIIALMMDSWTEGFKASKESKEKTPDKSMENIKISEVVNGIPFKYSKDAVLEEDTYRLAALLTEEFSAKGLTPEFIEYSNKLVSIFFRKECLDDYGEDRVKQRRKNKKSGEGNKVSGKKA